MEKKIFDFTLPLLCSSNDDLTKTWYISYYIIEPCGYKKRMRLYGGINKGKTIAQRYKIAEKLLQNLTVQLQSELLPTSKYKRYIKDVLLDILAKRKNELRKKTYQSYVSKITGFCAYLDKLNIFKIELVTYEVVEKIKEMMLNDGLNNTTINQYINKIRYVFDSLVKLKEVKKNPFAEVKMLKENPQGAMYFKEHQISYIKENIETQNPLLWLACQTLFYCFIRPGEMRNLKVCDFDLIEATLTVPAEISKNKKRQTVQIPDSFLPTLRAYLKGRDKNDYFLLINGKQININYLNTEHRKIMNTLGFGKRYVFYSWKHTGAVQVAKSNIPLKQLQMQLRHHSLDQVNEYLREMGIFEAKELKANYPKL